MRATLLAALALALATPQARAANPRLSEGPLAVEAQGAGDPVADEPTPASLADDPTPAPVEDAPTPGPARIPTQISTDAESVRVAVGLGPSAPGSREEKALVSALEQAARASTEPRVELRRLRAGAGAPRRICRERADDLIIMVDYVADRPEPVLVPHDCTLDRPLGIRGAAAATEPGLVRALWDEHEALIRDGVQARRAGLAMNPKVRTGLIAGSAILVVGAAVGLILASTLRSETVVITVGP
ncbi:MAG: hypothetical protein H6713_21280 [Myxococcales bacterium]|nr:hypothetical protein [Myxococcales bacterium]